MALLIRSSLIHAAGCFTTEAIPKGARLLEYDGYRIHKDDADRIYEDSPLTYLFGIGNRDQVIDGHCMAMFLNHSCDPNCDTGDRGGRMYIQSIRDIAPGEELVYDYNLYDGEEADNICRCGAAHCRGTMFSPEEIAKRERARKRELKRQAQK